MADIRIDVSFEELIAQAKQAKKVVGELKAEGRVFGDSFASSNEKASKAMKGYVGSLKTAAFKINNIKNAETDRATKLRVLEKLQQKITESLAEYIEEGKDLKQINTDMKSVKQAIKNVKDEQESLNKEAEKSPKGFKKIGSAIQGFIGKLAAIAIVAKIFGFFKTAAQEAKEFESALSELSAITGLTGDDLKNIGERAKVAASELNVSAKTFIEATTLIGSAKPDLLGNAEALEAVTRRAITLAKAAKIDLKSAANTLGVSLNQFNEGAKSADRFINILAAGSKEGSSLINETALALKNVGTVAGNLGLSFEETNALIQTTADIGLKGSEAGTGIKSFLLKLSSEVDEFNPKVVGLQTALQNLNKAGFADSTKASKRFGETALIAAQQLISNSDRVNELTDALTGTSTAYEQAEANGDNFEGSLSALNNALKALAVDVGEVLIPALKDIADSITPIIKKVSQVVNSYKQFQKSGGEVNVIMEQLGLTLSDFRGFETITLNNLNRSLKDLTGNLSQGKDIEFFLDKLSELKRKEQIIREETANNSGIQQVALALIGDAVNEVTFAYQDYEGSIKSASKTANENPIKIDSDVESPLKTMQQIQDKIDSLKKQKLLLEIGSTGFNKVKAEIDRLQKIIDRANGKNSTQSEKAAKREAERAKKAEIAAAKQKEKEQESNKLALIRIEEDLQVKLSNLRKAAALKTASDTEDIEIKRKAAQEEVDLLENSIKKQIALRELQSVEFSKLSETDRIERIANFSKTVVIEAQQQKELKKIREAIDSNSASELTKLLNTQSLKAEEEKLELEKSRINIKAYINDKKELITDEMEVEKLRQNELDALQTKYLKKQIEYYQSLSDIQLSQLGISQAQLETIINNLKAKIEGLEPEPIELSKLFGFEVTEADKKILESSFKALIGGVADFYTASIDNQLEASKKIIEGFDSEILALESRIEREQELHDKGAANYLQTEKDKLEGVKGEREKAAKEAQKLERKRANQQLISDTATQVSNMITAGTAILKSEASKGIIGVALGALALGSLFKIFASFKKRAQAQIPSYRKGKSRILYSKDERGVDAHLSYLDKDERVTTGENNLENWDIYEGIKQRNHRQFKMGVVNYVKRNNIELDYSYPVRAKEIVTQQKNEDLMIMGKGLSNEITYYLGSIDKKTTEIVRQGKIHYSYKEGELTTIKIEGESRNITIENIK